MTYLLCPVCPTAADQWGRLRGHIMGAHKTEIDPAEIPTKEQIQTVDELPEGYQLMKEKKKAPVRTSASAEPEYEQEEEPTPVREKVAAEEKPKKKTRIPTELPEDFLERTELSLTVHNFPTALATQILNVLALHPEAHDNPNNFGNLLSHICSTYPGGATHARKIGLVVSEVFGPPTQEMPYTAYPQGQPAGAFGWQQGGGYSPYGGQPGIHEDPMTQFIRYQMYKDSKEAEKEKEIKLPATFEAEMSAMRQDYQALSSQLEEQRKRAEEDVHKAEIAELRAEIRAASESKSGGQNEWLQAFLNERDKREDEAKKRLEDIINTQNERLAAATNELANTNRNVDARIIDAINREKTAREEVRKEMKDEGWTTKTQTKEELDHKLFEQGLSIIPDKIDKGFDKIVDRLAPGGQSPITSPSEQPKPRSVTEIAEQTKIEDEILDEMKRRI